MKLILAVPTYGPPPAKANRSLRAAIMFAANHGVQWVGDASPDRMKFDAARNAAVTASLQTEADAIMWVDSDVILPQDSIARLVASGKDFVSGIYFQRGLPHWPLIAHFDDQKKTFNWWTRWPANVVAPIDGCGFGCVLTSTKMLRAMGEGPWFTFEQYSEDFDFCLRAARAGYQLYVDTGVLCGHLGDEAEITQQDFHRVRDFHATRPIDQPAQSPGDATVLADRPGRGADESLPSAEIRAGLV